MVDSAVSNIRTTETEPVDQAEEVDEGWLLLIHQLPAEPAYLRVKVLRRLKRVGALGLKGSVYLLPHRESCREDFHWVIREIEAGGGSATLSAARFLEGTSDRELRALFDQERDREYGELAEAVRAVAGGDATRSDVDRLRRSLAEIRERDHFGAAGAAPAEHAVAELDRGLTEPAARPPVEPGQRYDGATWVTRRGVFVDRMASAWLIRRFIDPRARFRFVDSAHPASEREIAFDMYDGGYTHEGDRCTFETLLARFGLADPGLATIAEIVHDIDCKDAKFGRSEAAGIASVLRGIAAANPSDEDRVAAAGQVFDGLLSGLRVG